MTDGMNDKKYLTPQDRTCLANSIFDTLCDLRMYPSSNSSKDILDLASSDEKAALVLNRLLLALLPTKPDDNVASWKELSLVLIHQQKELQDVLGILYSTLKLIEKEDPSNDKRLEILFHLVTAVQQKRLLKLDQEEDKSPEEELSPDTDDISLPITLPITLPSHFSPKQRALVASCYQHLSKDYEFRLQGLHQRLCILQANLGSNSTDLRPILNVTSIDAAELQIKLSQPVSISSKRQLSKTIPLRDVHIKDRGGRVDTADARNPVMPEWTKEREETPSGRGGRGGRGGGRGGRGRGGGRRNNHNNRSKRQN